MNYLLDTNVVSEWVKPRPDAGVIEWLAAADEDRLYLSVPTLAELRQGVQRLAPGQRRNRLDTWLRDDLPLRFDRRILAIDAAVADAWGVIVARGQATGRSISAMDAFIAATAEIHDLTLVTRNVADFGLLQQPVLNPWMAD
ncbi:type II toxin-antitoxin system VapC family toxin [Nitrospirillum viridazoti]|uniref:Ribonuclease VapC n=1 Tax=Nitrospirillum viridazoti CBAmc TaxID=1441467 RepID=A0A248JYD2_9PROT|nr:type II toxin-antitoxin system VapC family toxin [Nitrospirillum amazonense]ASG23725.1 VapC toxin family PIN domain ribonuclease [Nitrospirillum amazonense CBAmc]TWB44879.1 hypothetical protein FBZ91_101350 [Nitrospirillum amazonense]